MERQEHGTHPQYTTYRRNKTQKKIYKIVRLLPGLQPFEWEEEEEDGGADCTALDLFGVFHITRITTHPIIYLYAEAFGVLCWPSSFSFLNMYI